MRRLSFHGGLRCAGLGTGLLTTLLFCLPPLLDVRAVRPVLVLRRLVEQGPEGLRGWFATLVGAAIAIGNFGAWWLRRWAELPGRCPIQPRWAHGLQCCSRRR